VLEPGETTLAIGASSRDLRLTTTIDIAGANLPPTLDGMATLEEWLADPTGGPMLRDAIGTDESGRRRGIFGNDELLAVIGKFLISPLVASRAFISTTQPSAA